jgi:release factor glutamine methyltransferase
MNPAIQEWTIGKLLDWTARHLAEKGSEFPRLDAEVLLAHALGCKRIDLYTRYDETAKPEACDRYRGLIGRRIEGCPVAYLVGYKEFFSLRLEVGPAVLIPRPESEFVVMECLRLAEKMEAPEIVDIGTGSGNIGIAVAHQYPGARVIATDLSSDALALAQRNAEKHHVADRIEFLQGDLFAPVAADKLFDFVLSNPPYIPSAEIPSLPAGVRDYEPHLALDGGADGYQVLERLIGQAKEHLRPGGFLIVEIGAPQELPARQRIQDAGGFGLGPTIYDYSGHARVLRAERKPS